MEFIITYKECAGDKYTGSFVCHAFDYDDAENQFHNNFPSYLIINITKI